MTTRASINLADYQTGELAARVVSLLAIPLSLRRVLFSALCVAGPLVVVTVVLFGLAGASGWVWIGATVYSLAAGLVVGAAFGLLQVASVAVRDTQELMGLVLGASKRVAADYAHMREGTRQLPAGGELVQQVFRGVLLPVIERSVSKLFGSLGKPLLAAYRGTIGSAVKRLVRATNLQAARDTSVSVATAPITDAVAIAEGQTDAYSRQIEAYLGVARATSETIAGRMRWLVLWPATALFALVTLVVSLPLVVLLFMIWK